LNNFPIIPFHFWLLITNTSQIRKKEMPEALPFSGVCDLLNKLNIEAGNYVFVTAHFS